MNTNWTWIAIAGLALLGVYAFGFGTQREMPNQTSPKRQDKLVMTEAEWKKKLTPEQYRILRGHGTEAAFCSPMNDVHKKGIFYCVGCGQALFRTDAKFTSGTGWPSFFQPASKDSVWTRVDNSYGMHRFEVLCSKCDGHLGHVFDDGPRPTGLRYCINGEVLKFEEAK